METVGQRLNNFKIDPATGCWIWKRCVNSAGYGHISIGNQALLVHRVIACIYFGVDYDDKRHALHKCNNKRCINPTHLYLGTRSDNVQDTIRAGTYKAPGRNRGKRMVN